MNPQRITAFATLVSLLFCICMCSGCTTTAKLLVVDGTSGKPLSYVSAEQFGESSNYFGDRNETRQPLGPTGQDGTLVVDAAISPLRNNEIHLSCEGYAPAVVLTRGGTTNKVDIVSPADFGAFGPAEDLKGSDLGWQSAEHGYFKVPLFRQLATTRPE